jgi:NIMA (never in mitosis gene a)-related kinase
MEFCEGGDLKQLIDLVYYNQNKFTVREIFDIFIQICEGLNYLHNRNIIHRDIKSQNIFLTKNNIVRIGDFGLAKKLKKNKRVMSYMTKVGTDCYMAPEVMQGETYGKSADVWSLGCVIHEVCTLSFMWMHDTTVGLASLTQKEYLDSFLNQINNDDYCFVVDLLKNIFVTSKEFCNF